MPDTGNGGKIAETMQSKWTLPVIVAVCGLFFTAWQWDSTRQAEVRKATEAQSQLLNQVQNLERQMASLQSQTSALNDRLSQGLAAVPTLQERFAYLQPIPQKIAEMDRALVTLQSQAAIVAQGLDKSLQEADRRANQYNTSLQQIREMLFSLRLPRNGSTVAPEFPLMNDWPHKAKQEYEPEAVPIVRRKDVSDALRRLSFPKEPQWRTIARVCLGPKT